MNLCSSLATDLVVRVRYARLAERQMGEFLKAMPKAKGGAQYHPEGSPTAPMTGERQPRVPTLADIGISKDQSKSAQKLASIPAEEFAERIAVVKAGGTYRIKGAELLKLA